MRLWAWTDTFGAWANFERESPPGRRPRPHRAADNFGNLECRVFQGSAGRRVFAFDFDLAEGKRSDRRTYVVIPPEMGVADSMDIDMDRNLWIAHWGGWCVGKWDLRTGELLEKAEVPACRAAGCAFGGKLLRAARPCRQTAANSRTQGAFLWRAALEREGFPSTASREREAGGNSLLEKRHRLLLGDNIEFPAGRRARSGERARGEFPDGEWEGFYGRRG